jgi:hypothetical protein
VDGPNSNQAPNCHLCEYFHVTWDRSFPMGCKYFGFKTRQLPSVEVLTSSGMQCNVFTPKSGAEGPTPKDPPPDTPRDGSTFTATA